MPRKLVQAAADLKDVTMAMIKCYECGADVSDQAQACPHCGAVQSWQARAKAAQKAKIQASIEYNKTPEGKKQLRIKRIAGAIAAVAILIMAARCGANRSKTSEQPVAVAVVPIEQKIAPSAVDTYSKANNPKMHKAWGDSGLKRLNELAPKAALAVAANKGCDRVEIIGLSFERSNPPKEAVFFADCANKERFYVTESEIASGQSSGSEREKMAARDEVEYLTECEYRIKAQLKNPSTFDRAILDTETRLADTGVMVVRFPFTAQNDFGAKLDSVAECSFRSDGQTTATIARR